MAQEAGWAPGPVWTDAENLDSTGIRTPDRPARGESLYLVPVMPKINCTTYKKILILITLMNWATSVIQGLLNVVCSQQNKMFFVNRVQ
jgi:hypothetical protein